MKEPPITEYLKESTSESRLDEEKAIQKQGNCHNQGEGTEGHPCSQDRELPLSGNCQLSRKKEMEKHTILTGRKLDQHYNSVNQKKIYWAKKIPKEKIEQTTTSKRKNPHRVNI